MTLIAVSFAVVAVTMFVLAIVSIMKGRFGSAALFAVAFFLLGGLSGAFLASS